MKVFKGPGRFYRVSADGLAYNDLQHIRFTVPSNYRYYENGSWFVHEDHLPASGKECLLSQAYEKLYLQPNAPRSIVDAVWKALARIHHPDVGGDAEAFKDIQAAYRKIINGP